MPFLLINRLRIGYISGGLFFVIFPEYSNIRKISLSCETENAEMGWISTIILPYSKSGIALQRFLITFSTPNYRFSIMFTIP